VLVDEAGQAPEAEVLCVLGLGCRRLLLCGDPKQLPATTLSAAAVSAAYPRSLLERLMLGGRRAHLLDTQYRMAAPIAAFPADEGKAVLSAMKVLGDMDIAEKRRPQDGTFTVLMEDRRFDVRAASAPTNFGEKMALRLLDADGGIVKGGLGSIGMKDSVVAQLREIIQQPHGMLIVCGPTGSGKTTTLYSALSEIDVNSKNIITIEDPIEYRLEGISQTAVNVAAELTFAKILRSTLRQDPDVILVGEVRDKETAEIAMQAAMTGHFVFTTLHANDAPTTITRLLDIGVEATLIQSAVSAVLAQRLVRVLCPKCKQAVQLSDELKEKWGIAVGKDVTIYQEKGCPACHGTGFRGRTGLHELMIFDNSIRELLVGRPSMQTIRQAARKGGMKTLLEAGVGKVLAGVTSVSEMQRVAK
jgi:type II secretory ATPase GspE/PulE/Tfp pilus assembly ATPase PilB-like protein